MFSRQNIGVLFTFVRLMDFTLSREQRTFQSAGFVFTVAFWPKNLLAYPLLSNRAKKPNEKGAPKIIYIQEESVPNTFQAVFTVCTVQQWFEKNYQVAERASGRDAGMMHFFVLCYCKKVSIL